MRTRIRFPKVLAFLAANDLAVASSEMSYNAACPACKTPLELHQPDLTTPERLLGICPGCHSWTLVHQDEGGQTRLTRLSDPE